MKSFLIHHRIKRWHQRATPPLVPKATMVNPGLGDCLSWRLCKKLTESCSCKLVAVLRGAVCCCVSASSIKPCYSPVIITAANSCWLWLSSSASVSDAGLRQFTTSHRQCDHNHFPVTCACGSLLQGLFWSSLGRTEVLTTIYQMQMASNSKKIYKINWCLKSTVIPVNISSWKIRI